MLTDQLLCSSHLSNHQWTENLGDPYYNLRNSPDALIREYYFEQQTQISRPGPQNVGHEKFERHAHFLSNRVHTEAHPEPPGIVLFYTFRSDIHKDIQIPLKPGDPVYFQPFLIERLDPDRYARRALFTDPASHLLVGLKATKGGKDWQA